MQRILAVAALVAAAAWSLVVPSNPAVASLPAHDPERVLVGFAPGTPEARRVAVHATVGATVEASLAALGVDVVRLPVGSDVAAFISAYQTRHEVVFAEPNTVGVAAAAREARPDDAYVTGAWEGRHLRLAGGDVVTETNDVAWSLQRISAFRAWTKLHPVGAPWPQDQVTLGVIDSGLYAEHEDLAGKLVPGCRTATSGQGVLVEGCFDDNGHGTHVAGTAAATANNGVGIAGVAFNARLAICKALDRRNVGYVVDFAACIVELASRGDELGLRVISMSILSAPGETLKRAVDYAWGRGVLVIAAAGNDASPSAPLCYPAAYPNVVSVAATDRNDGRWVAGGPSGPGPVAGSTANDDVEISAPGAGVLSTVPWFRVATSDGANEFNSPTSFGTLPASSGYATLSGTSMATPHVAAAAALIAQRRRIDDPALLRDTLVEAVDDLGPAGRDPVFGFGRLNLALALGDAS